MKPPYYGKKYKMNPTKLQCQICGARCCYKKQHIAESIVWTTLPCEFLNKETKLCNIYNIRFEKCPSCYNLEQAKKLQFLPETCPYVIEDEQYRGPLRR